MKKQFSLRMLAGVYGIVLLLFLAAAAGGSRAVSALAEVLPATDRTCIIIDAGHGGEDGGAISCSGIPESQINLEIALRLEDMLHFLGFDTEMIRRTDQSVYTQGETIAAKKVSDLKERVRIVNTQEQALLISIHQNYFTDDRYYGPQVFYGKAQASNALAENMQNSLVKNLNPSSKRRIKPAENIYLMERVECTAVLVECGFLSNPQEEAKLCNADYQKQLSCIIAVETAKFISLDLRTNE